MALISAPSVHQPSTDSARSCRGSWPRS